PTAFLVAGTLFLTITAPVQLDAPWLSVAWAVEALALMWFGARQRVYEMRVLAMAVFALVAVRILAFDTVVGADGYMILLNERSLAYGPVIVAMGMGAYLYHSGQAHIRASEEYALPALVVAANFLALVALSAEIFGAIDNNVIGVAADSADSVKSLGLTVLWAVYASIALALGFWRRWRLVRLGSLFLLAIPVIKLFTFDAFQLEPAFRVAGFLVLGLLLVLAGYFYQRHSAAVREFLT
ncbi:MAG: DUF2339 domain-containing protein, partial [Chloroflexi bacterium]|nr:DUF2339 domain-containing protein [Chloroflexota bacterium]